MPRKRIFEGEVKRVHFLVEAELWNRFAELCKDNNLTPSEVLRRFIHYRVKVKSLPAFARKGKPSPKEILNSVEQVKDPVAPVAEHPHPDKESKVKRFLERERLRKLKKKKKGLPHIWFFGSES